MKSNHDQWNSVLLITSIGVILVGIILLISYLANKSGSDISGNYYYLKNGNFSVYLPNQPVYSSYNSITPGDFYISSINNAHFDAIHITHPFNGNLGADKNLTNLIAQLVSNDQGLQISSSSLGNFNGFPSIDFTATDNTAKVNLVGRCVLVGDDLYVLKYAYSQQEDVDFEKTFLNSLKLGMVKGDTILPFEK